MKSGFSLIEIVVAASIIAFFVSGATVAGRFGSSAVENSSRAERAAALLEEGVEVARILRDVSWSGSILPLVSGTTYYPVYSINWKIVTADPGPIDGLYTRTLVFGDVYRKSADDDIVDVSGPDSKYLDAGTRQVTITVSWANVDKSPRQESLSTYLTDLFSN